MEAAIRWSSSGDDHVQRFLLVDVAGNTVTLNELREDSEDGLQTERLARYDKVSNFTAFDWSKSDSSLVALGLSSGDASLLQLDPDRRTISQLCVFPIRTQRKVNSVSFNLQRLLAVGLDRVRNDHCLTVYDVDAGKEPAGRLCIGEGCSSVRFFPSQPQELIAAVSRTTLRLYDLRESATSSVGSSATVFTKQTHNIAIDPLDDNFIASGGSTGEPTVSIWDKRWIARSATSAADGAASQSLLELRPAVDNSITTSVWSIRFSGLRRGRFGVLSSTGAVRLYDLASHSAAKRFKAQGTASFGTGSSWTGEHYVQRTHDIQHPYYDKLHGQEEGTRVTAFDWVTSGAADGQRILALRLTREVNVLSAPRPQHLLMTARDDLAIAGDGVSVMSPAEPHKSIADEVLDVKRRLDGTNQPARRSISGHHGRRVLDSRPLNAQTLESLREPSAVALQRTQSWVQAGPEPIVSHTLKNNDFKDALTIMSVHRRRCQEGYQLDAARNRQIIKDDPALERMWAIIHRFEMLAANGGMVSETMDLSLFGVQGIWRGSIGTGLNRILPNIASSAADFDASLQYLIKLHGLRTLDNLPSRTTIKRLLCLEMCGWCFSREAIEGKCANLLDQRQLYRAVAVAAFQGHRDLSLNMLRNLTRGKIINDVGVGALLAAGTLNKEQKEMCRWMEEDATDPYLKSLLRYIGERDWHSVAENTSLLLSDRLSVALRYLSDTEVASFIGKTTAACVTAGDPSGVLLTGLTEGAMPLFQNFLTRTNDLQTVVLAASLAAPLYVDDVRFQLWRETYLDLLQHWRLFIERTRYTTEHNRRSIRRDGTKLFTPAPRQISLRCVHCNGTLARPATEDGGRAGMSFGSAASNSSGPVAPQLTSSSTSSSTGTARSGSKAQRVADASGTTCPRCGRHLPRCAVCMQWLGTPEPTLLGKNAAAASPAPVAVPAEGGALGAKRGEGKGGGKALEAALARFVTFCASCGHGLHAHHARQWFAKHGMCPVPDCGCLCGVRR